MTPPSNSSSVSSITLSLTALTGLLVFVACSPSKDRAPITRQIPTAAQQVLLTCRDSLQSSLVYATPESKKAVVQCLSVDPSKPGLERTRALSSTPVSYRLSKESSGQIKASMKVGLKTRVAMNEKDQTTFLNILQADCLNPIRSIFQRSVISTVGSLALGVDTSFEEVKESELTDTTDSFDHHLSFTKYSENGDIVFTIDDSPTHARFYPNGKANGKDSDKSVETRAKANAPFCRELSLRVAGWLGIVSIDREQLACGLVPTSIKPEPEIKISNTDSTFSKPASDDAESYLKTATLNSDNIIKLLTPACPNLDKKK